MTKYKFVVITPTIPGRESKLASAVASVSSQLLTDYLHVVVGDGPAPSAEAVVCDIPRTVYTCLPEHQGQASCINHALANYEAERYLFLDDDNILLPKCLKTIYENAGDNAIVVHKVLFFNKWTSQWITLPNAMPPGRANIDLLNFSVRADVARLCKFELERKHELDWFYYEQCLQITGNKFHFIDDILAVYF